jgi:hypothetical protein
MTQRAPLTLPHYPSSRRRKQWKLTELIDHWNTQGLPTINLLVLSWAYLENPERPDGLVLVTKLPDGSLRTPEPVTPAALVEMRRMKLSRGDVASELWLTPELARWLLEQVEHDGKPPDRDGTVGPGARPTSYDDADDPLLEEMHRMRQTEPELKVWSAAGRVADRADGDGTYDSRRRRLTMKYKTKIVSRGVV